MARPRLPKDRLRALPTTLDASDGILRDVVDSRKVWSVAWRVQATLCMRSGWAVLQAPVRRIDVLLREMGHFDLSLDSWLACRSRELVDLDARVSDCSLLLCDEYDGARWG